MNGNGDARNPTGLTLTQEQKDHSERNSYRHYAVRYGLQYYVTGRFATAHRFTPVSANILHHAVELLLKACLAADDPISKIRAYGSKKKGYDHNIAFLWQEFKARRVELVPAEFDAIIGGLHAFEEIRYPEKLISKGATISIGVFEVEKPITTDRKIPDDLYLLMLPQIDRLVGLLFYASGVNSIVFLPDIVDDEQSMRYYEEVRQTLFGEPKSKAANA